MGAVNSARISGSGSEAEKYRALQLAAQRAPAIFADDLAKVDYQRALANPPPPAPDLTDAAVRAARIEGLGAIGKGRKSTFLSGTGGYGAPTQAKRKTLLGGE